MLFWFWQISFSKIKICQVLKSNKNKGYRLNQNTPYFISIKKLFKHSIKYKLIIVIITPHKFLLPSPLLARRDTHWTAKAFRLTLERFWQQAQWQRPGAATKSYEWATRSIQFWWANRKWCHGSKERHYSGSRGRQNWSQKVLKWEIPFLMLLAVKVRGSKIYMNWSKQIQYKRNIKWGELRCICDNGDGN